MEAGNRILSQQVHFVLFAIAFILIPQTLVGQQVWEASFDSINSLSSPRAIDLNLDGVKDIVFGGGFEEDSSQLGFIAIDGETGSTMWTAPSNDQVFSSPMFMNINGDQYPDVVLGGREAQLLAFDGFSGAQFWEFYSDTISPDSVGLYNFYTGQPIPDQNSDFIEDILITNGGDKSADPQDTLRPTGHVMIISGLDGGELARMAVPDSQETYCSPVVDYFGSNELWAVYGTGGETNRGGLWKTKISDVMLEDATNSILLHSSDSNGYVAPPSLADLNGDLINDVIFNNYAGHMAAINGATNLQMWERSFINTESNVNPAIGKLNSDGVPDVITTIGFGEWFIYEDFVRLILDGANGSVLDSVSLQAWNLAGNLAVDVNADGIDDVVSARTDRHFNLSLGADVYTTTVLIEEPSSGDTIFQFGPHSGGNPFYTPLVADLDNNGLLDIVYIFIEDSLNMFSKSKLTVRRLETNLPVPSNISWGAYLGTGFDGTYHEPAVVSVSELEGPNAAEELELNSESMLYNLIGQEVSKELNAVPDGVYFLVNGVGETSSRIKVLVLRGRLFQ